MAETLITGHELILKVYDEEGGELLYSEGFSQEPNMDVDEYLAERNISLSGNASIEICCELTGDCQAGYSPDASFQQILSEYPGGGEIERCYLCTEVDEEAGKCTYGETLCRTALEIPATVEMRVYGALKKENNQHGAIFTWHSVRDEDYSAMRGPCEEGFHVPIENERQAIKTAIETRWSGNIAGQVSALANYLKIPLAGYLTRTSGSLAGQSTWGTYWMCTARNSSQGRSFDIQSSSIALSNTEKGVGQSIRPFKDKPVIPDNSWIVEYQGTGDAGIYSNSILGLVSLSIDGTNWITIADKNIGATAVYNVLNTLSESNCGYFFQRGNNYGFPYGGAVTTSSTAVSAAEYGPGNYYNSSTFITQTSWDSSYNNNLWGAVTGVQSGYKLLHRERYIDYSAMRGPCPEGFHVPSKSEFQAITDAGITISAWGNGTLGTNMLSYLKIPLSGYHGTNISLPGTSYHNSQAGLHCCTCTGTYYADTLWFGGATSTYNDTWKYSTSTGRGFGYFIRPFKDTPIMPDSDWTVLYDGSSVSSGAGIFHNADLGLISISEDGTNWTTIADKNLGATIVYNNGDTLNENNCGGWFQWGNNYMFPFSASFTYSTETVDATGYGPGNYYNSSTYIGASQWDTSNNKNLRGGVTGAVENGRRVI